MRTVVVIMGILSVLGIGASAQTKAQGTSVTLKVSGMSCGACAARVEKTAKEIDGVTSAKASQPKGVAEITFDPAKIKAEDIAALITKKSGFVAEVPKK
jgi:copper chaperone CopZ